LFYFLYLLWCSESSATVIDPKPLLELVRLHHRTLYRTARAILRDDAEAEDAVQEACLRAYKALGTFRGESQLSTWLVRITANEALMRRRSRVRAATVAPMDPEAQPDDQACAQAGPESHAEHREMRLVLQERIGALPEEFRAVFVLRAVEELTVGETAAVLAIPEATVRTRYFRARRLLKEAMARDIHERSSLDTPLLITPEDRARLMQLKPNAALLREIDRASVISLEDAVGGNVVTMNTQVLYTEEASGAQHRINVVFPQQAGGCACCVSVLAPIGTALIGLSAHQAIEWDFPDGSHRRLRVQQVIHENCPLNVST
jgi:RNA polymerase sigma-70 factor (ECF subfamily)